MEWNSEGIPIVEKTDPEKDGITHINVYSKGRTELGRLLTNFAYTPFECEDGHFDSVEGYWYWLGCGDDRLRYLYGFKAKKLGRELRAPDWQEDPEFKVKICRAIEIKIETHRDIFELMKTSELPFVHYYVSKTGITEVPQGKWIMEALENIRYWIQQGIIE